MENAEIAGNLHATGNYSYTCKRMSGRSWLMVGDAYAFVDPIFSTGVFLAMYSAELAADVVSGALREPTRERRLQRAYERNVRNGLSALSWFIFRFKTPAHDLAVPQPAQHAAGRRSHDLHAGRRCVPGWRSELAAAVLQAAVSTSPRSSTGAIPSRAGRSGAARPR